MAGPFMSKLKGRGEYKGDLRKVPCKYADEEHIAAEQIFPVIRHDVYYTPTIKHHCARTAVASSLRACSNKVGSDPKMQEEFNQWFRTKYIPDFLKCMGKELVTLNMETWLSKYKESYRKAARECVDCNHQTTKGNLDTRYDAFTKVEMQFTTVPHDLKDTFLNEVKERQICGPCFEKKVYANAFINLLEEVATKHFKHYCGRQNWIQICEALQKGERQGRGRRRWFASDGSGFDMTQLKAMNLLMNELIVACAKHQNVVWNEPFSVERLIEALEGSLLLNVSMDKGALQYVVEGRASGDGWTTFGNTMLMIAYWEFTFHKAGITDYYLKVKGDDVLFNLNVDDIPKLEVAVSQVFTKGKHEHNHGLGQICKKIDQGDLTDLDFLSNEFFLTKEGNYRMTRIPARVLQTNSWTTKLPPQKLLAQRQELCFAKGMCLKAWADGLPIFGVLADKMIELGKPGKLTTYDEYADGGRVWHQGRDDYEAYMVYLNSRYGIGRREVESAERKIRSLKRLDGFLDLPELSNFYLHL